MLSPISCWYDSRVSHATGIIESATDGEVQQPFAYSGDGACKAISDERNGSRNSANWVAELCQFGYRSRSDDFAIGIESAFDPKIVDLCCSL